jgi:hypothetical protein
MQENHRYHHQHSKNPISRVKSYLISSKSSTHSSHWHNFINLNTSFSIGDTDNTLKHQLRSLSLSLTRHNSYRNLIYNFNLDKFQAGQLLDPKQLYDMKKLMFFQDKIEAKNIELYSNQNRMIIREVNRKFLNDVLKKYPKIFEGDFSRFRLEKDEHEKFKTKFGLYIRQLCYQKQKEIEENEHFSWKRLDTETTKYLLYVTELGLLEKENMIGVLSYLTKYTEYLSRKITEFFQQKTKATNFSDTESSLEDSSSDSDLESEENEVDEEDDTCFERDEESFSENDSDFHREKSSREKNLRGKSSRGKLSRGNLHREETIYQKQQDEKKIKKTLIRIMENLSQIILLIIVSINDNASMKAVTTLKQEKMKFEDLAKEKFGYFFEKKTSVKLVIETVMRILGCLDGLEYEPEVSCLKIAFKRSEFFHSMNQVFMTLLSIRNDPLVTSHESSTNFSIESKESLENFVNTDYSTHIALKTELINNFNKIVSNKVETVNTGQLEKIQKLLRKLLKKSEGFRKRYQEKIEEKEEKELTELDEKELKLIRKNFEDFKTRLNMLNFPCLLIYYYELFSYIFNFALDGQTDERVKNRLKGKIENLMEILENSKKLIIFLLEDSCYGQSAIFQMSTSKMFWSIIKSDPLRNLDILEKIFKNDTSILFKNTKNYQIFLEEMDSIIFKYDQIFENEQITKSERLKAGAVIFMVFRLYEQILRKNADNSEERMFGTTLHEKYGDRMRNGIREYFDDLDNFNFIIYEYKQFMVKYENDHFSKMNFFLNKIKDSKKIEEKLRIVEAEIHYSYLKLYNESTEN